MSCRLRYRAFALALLVGGWAAASTVRAQCPTEPRLENYTGAGSIGCPCFVPGEQAGAVLDLPASEFPIEILKIGIGWGSQFGGAPDQLEEAIHIYAGGLPDPGAPVFTLAGPVLIDGVINEFDLEPLPGEIIIDSGPFTVTLEFLNQNAGDPFSPTVVHDGNGCQSGKNVVFAVPGGWNDACVLGVTGDWVFYVFYRKTDCGGVSGNGSVPDGDDVPGTPLLIGKTPTGQLSLSWDASCSSNDDQYGVYTGFLGAYYSHFSTICNIGTTSVIVAPDAFDRYYLVVPNDGLNEGSYGRDSGDLERPAGGAACESQQMIGCP
jgi:hypothetical protein